MKPRPKIVICAPSPRWRSTLEFLAEDKLADANLVSTDDWDEFFDRIRLLKPPVAIWELELAKLPEVLEQYRHHWAELSRTLCIAVGDEMSSEWRAGLRGVGFADIIDNLGAVETMLDRVARHLASLPIYNLDTLEDKIFESLPWSPLVR